jgi:dihydroneopterin aldolase
MDYIELNNMIFHAFHGIFPQERKVGNTFTVNLRIQTDLGKASLSDSPADTINYAAVFETVKHEMLIPSNLLEHAAGRIVRRIKEQFPAAGTVEIRIAKHNPPVDGQVGEAVVALSA